MIDLASRSDFSLGRVRIRPASLEIVAADTIATIEPKVMQMLIVLADATGRVVSRDVLIQQCWGGRVVGEDAINRVIGKLRRAVEGAAGGAFKVDTVARVGLRLLLSEADAQPTTANAPGTPADPVEPPRKRPTLPILLGIAAIALVVGIASWPWRPKLAPRHIASALPSAVTDLETRGLSAMFEDTPDQTAEGVGYLRQATTLAPFSAPIWGSLAMNYVLALGWAPEPERGAISARVRGAAEHAQRLDPRETRSAAALVSLVPTFRNWTNKEHALRTTVDRVDPDQGPLLYQQIQFLIDTGHTREALVRVGPLVKASPLVPWVRAADIDLLAAAGRLEDADRAAAAAFAIWPRDRLIWFTCFDLAAFNGQPDRALAMASDRAGWPKLTDADDILLAARAVRAMVSHDAPEVARVLEAYQVRASLSQGHAERAMRVAIAFERPESALAFARLLYAGNLPADPHTTMLPRIGNIGGSERPTAALFMGPARLLWSQRKFFVLISRTGLVDYWRHTTSPDVCRVGAASQLCRDVIGPNRLTVAQSSGELPDNKPSLP